MTLTRRDTLASLAARAAVLLAADRGRAAPMGSAPSPAPPTGPPGPAGEAQVKPLPFNPKRLKGLSRKLIESHHGKNYAGAVKNLNRVRAELRAAAGARDVPPFVTGGLKQSELAFTNSVILHEHYFANLGGDGKPGGEIARALAATYGTLGAWEAHFRAVGASLGGGSGWVILAHDLHTNTLATHRSSDHTASLAMGVPLLVLDMYEHAYHLDYGADFARYVEAFFRNLDWRAVERRYQGARRAAAALAG